jgi:hypothetical protein
MILEKDLVQALNEYMECNNNRYLNEVRMGNGIPDAMIVLNIDDTDLYLDDYYHLKIYKLITDFSIPDVAALQKQTALPRRKVNSILSKLAQKDLLEINSGKITILKELNFDSQEKNIAIEVKIKDWKNGLLQAQRYLRYADYSYLAIKSDYIKNIDLKIAEQHGIGIIGIDGKNITEELKPRQSNKCNVFFKHIALSAFAAHNSSNHLMNDEFFSVKYKTQDYITDKKKLEKMTPVLTPLLYKPRSFIWIEDNISSCYAALYSCIWTT